MLIKIFPYRRRYNRRPAAEKSLAKWWASRAIPGSRIGGNSFEHRYRINLAALPFKITV